MENFTDEQISEVLGLCEAELQKMARESAVALAKGGDEPDESSEGSSGPAAPPADDGGAEESAEASGPPADDDGSAEASPPPAAAPEGAPEASADGIPDEAGEIHPAPTVEQLQAEFEALPDDQLKMMYLAAKQALASRMGAAGGAGAEMSAPPAGPEASAPAAPPAPPAGAPPALKSEAKVVAASKGNGGPLGKSERDHRIDTLEKKLQEQAKTLKAQDDALLGLAKKLATPIRKSVKGISDLPWLDKGGPEAPKAAVDIRSLSKAEIKAKLKERTRELASTGKLTKSDRDLIVAFDFGHVDVSKIEHLIVPAK